VNCQFKTIVAESGFTWEWEHASASGNIRPLIIYCCMLSYLLLCRDVASGS
jgi:hypothetical protein